MGEGDLILIVWYVFFGLIGALIYKKKRLLGTLIGLVAALILITILALLFGG
ncbi:hypothetical protein KAI04_02895 [Candidatus Pacearchaeota archaeon]|nr:hypothetical protein [Candidatus Pacearchaeota archaeon]